MVNPKGYEQGYAKASSVVVRVVQATFCGYTYLYYRLYAWNLRRWGKNDLPQWNAMYCVAFLSLMNIVTLVLLVSAATYWNAIFHAPKYVVLGSSMVWLVVNYYLLVSGGKYRKFEIQFANENQSRGRLNMLFCWIYVVVSFGAAIITGLVV